MGILFHCTNCERPLNVGEQFAGQAGVCPNCRKMIQVPGASKIAKINFRFLLDAWSTRKQVEDLESGSIDIESAVSASVQPPRTATMANPATNEKVIAAKRANGNSNGDSPPVVTLKPINVGGAQTETDSNKISVAPSIGQNHATSEKFSAGAPDLFNDNGHAVWFIRPPSGGQFGPASAKLLRQWIQEGRVTGDSYVWCEGWDNWQVAADVFPAIASKVSVEAIVAANADAVTAAQTRMAYIGARKRRTIRNSIGLLIGTAVLVGLIFVLIMVIKNSTA